MKHPVKFTFHSILFILLIYFIYKLYVCLRSPSAFISCAGNAVLGALNLPCKLLGINNKVCESAGAAYGSYKLYQMMSAIKKKMNEASNEAAEKAKEAGKTDEEATSDAEKAAEKAKQEETVSQLKQARAAGKSVKIGQAAGDEGLADAGAVEATAAGVGAEAATGELAAATFFETAMAGAAASGPAIAAVMLAVGVTVAVDKLTSWVKNHWKYCPCGWTYKDIVVPICYKGTCADEFGEGWREGKGSSGGMCIKCPKGYTNMGLWCGQGLKTASIKWKLRKTHPALTKEPKCSSDNKPSLLDDKNLNYFIMIIFLLLFIIIFIFNAKHMVISI